MPERSAVKREAREILGGAAVSPYLFTLLLLAISFAMHLVDEYISLPVTIARLEQLDPQLAASLPAFLRNASFPRLPGMFLQIMITLVSITLGAGATLYHLGIRRGEEMPYAVLFDGFGMAGRVVALGLLRALFIYLWSLLFVIPGIIAAYRYRFALYDLLENPELGPLEAIRMSRAQTAGFKWDLFVLDLSFLGWGLLSLLTMGLLGIWLNPYYRQTDLGYFQAVKRITGIGRLPEQERFDPFGDGRGDTFV
jgi:uncharacterized membrane protein